MSWRAQLRKASFRGVEFFVDSHDSAFGRRTVTHEYPLRDKPFVEDLGRKARTYTVEAYVLATAANGLNYMPTRDQLIGALEQPGPGPLVHPYLGELRVSCTESRLRETTAEGGMARFTLTFVESGEATFPSGQANTPSIVNMKADAAEDAILEEFEDKFSVDDLPEFVSASAVEQLGQLTDIIGGLPKLVPLNPEALAEFVPGLEDVTGGLGDLVRDPLALGKAVLGQIDLLRNLPKSPLDLFGNPLDAFADQFGALKMLRKLFDFGNAGSSTPKPFVPATTPTRIQQGKNHNATAALVQQAAVISAARAASGIEFKTFDDATAVREELVERLDEQMAATKSDDTYSALAALRTAVVQDVTARGANLARTVNYTPGTTLPALALAYDLYEDAERDAEIVARNRVRHPGFVSGGRPLEVLADA